MKNKHKHYGWLVELSDARLHWWDNWASAMDLVESLPHKKYWHVRTRDGYDQYAWSDRQWARVWNCDVFMGKPL